MPHIKRGVGQITESGEINVKKGQLELKKDKETNDGKEKSQKV